MMNYPTLGERVGAAVAEVEAAPGQFGDILSDLYAKSRRDREDMYTRDLEKHGEFVAASGSMAHLAGEGLGFPFAVTGSALLTAVHTGVRVVKALRTGDRQGW